MNPPDVSVPVAGALDAELLELLARQGRRVPIPVFLVALVTAAVAAEYVPIGLPAAWLLLVVVVLAGRWLILGRLTSLASLDVKTRLQLAVALSAINGVTHGLSLTFFWALPDFERAVQSMLLIGLCAGSVATTAGYMPVFLAYLIPTLAPLSVLWAVSATGRYGSWIEASTAVLIVFLGLVLVALARDAFRLFKESFEIRLQHVELNRRLTLALENAEASNRAKTRFLASASHDLRQPMHSLSIFAAALAMRELDDRSRGIVVHMNEALRDLSTELDSLLDVSKLDAGLVRVDRAPMELKPFLERVRNTFLAEAEAKNLRLELECPDGIFADTDKALLERAVRNLVENAIKYTDSGSVRLEVSASSATAKLTIADTGRGIPASEQTRVFDEFYQLGNAERDRARGLGLGLAIVKRLLDLLEINVALNSTEGGGSRFVLTLKRVQPFEQPLLAVTPLTPAFSLAGLHVLVVDDETKVRLGMRELLENLGCRVTDANSTEQAAHCARAERPDIVLVDFRLRGADDGIATVRAIRDLYPETPALLLSGDTAPERLREADAAGIALMHKPVPVEALKTAIASATGRTAGAMA